MKKAISILVITLVVSIALNIKLYTELVAATADEAKKPSNANANINTPKNITLPAKMKELRKLSKEEADCIGSPEVRQCTDAEWDAIIEKKAEKMKQICETEDHPNQKEACVYDKEKDKEYLKKRRQNLIERLQKKREKAGPNRHLK
jgi:hypothetical protein